MYTFTKCDIYFFSKSQIMRLLTLEVMHKVFCGDLNCIKYPLYHCRTTGLFFSCALKKTLSSFLVLMKHLRAFTVKCAVLSISIQMVHIKLICTFVMVLLFLLYFCNKLTLRTMGCPSHHPIVPSCSPPFGGNQSYICPTWRGRKCWIQKTIREYCSSRL